MDEQEKHLYGILVSFSVPILVYLAIVALAHLGNAQGSSEDFQYHDSYFVVVHMDPYVYPMLGVLTFAVYAVIIWSMRYVSRKSL